MLRVQWLADTGKTRRPRWKSCRKSWTCPPPAPHRVLRQLEHPGHQLGRPAWSCSSTASPRPPSTAASRSRRSRAANDVLPAWRRCCERRFKRAKGAQAATTRRRKAAHGRRCRLWCCSTAASGQLGAALDVMRELGLADDPHRRNREGERRDLHLRVDGPIVLPRTSQALYLVQRIRDEAHRFAITFHRELRGKRGIHSSLDEVEGVGPKRKKALIRKFGSVRAIREAELEAIAATPGLTRALAEKVKSIL